ncbi:MAG: hypothetical protein GY862_21565 [Gammaproteobacteria bacterium]|nr:hypothetical protein [Gammaproteobacteria bacterium]
MTNIRNCFLFCLISWGLFTPCGAEQDNSSPLRGRAFSDPARQQEMPKAWQDRPIRYKPWAKDADLAVTLAHQTYATHEVRAIPDVPLKLAVRPHAISFEVLWTLKQYGQKNKIKPLSINGTSPKDETKLTAGDYPLYRVYSVTTWEQESTRNPHARALVEYMIEQMERISPEYNVAPVSRLRAAGWKFLENELIGAPGD